jgi:hypothetical protein
VADMTWLDCLVERGSHLPENGKFLYSTERTLSKISLFFRRARDGKTDVRDQFFDRRKPALVWPACHG